MGPTKGNGRKKRTREHVIADLGVNHVENHVLRCGHTVERFVHDYGIDLSVHTYDSNGECENGAIRLQVKATDHLKVLADRRTISFRVDLRDVRHWREEIMPIIFVVYDTLKDKAVLALRTTVFHQATQDLIKQSPQDDYGLHSSSQCSQ